MLQVRMVCVSLALLWCASVASGQAMGRTQIAPTNEQPHRTPPAFDKQVHANVMLSPDGVSIAWTTTQAGTTAVWESSWQDVASAHTIGSVSGAVSRMEYVGGGTHIAIEHDGIVSALERASGTVRRVGPVEAGASLLAVSSHMLGTILVGINARDQRYFDVWRADVRTGAMQLVAEHPGVAGGWFIDGFAFDDSLRARLLIGRDADGGNVLLNTAVITDSDVDVQPVGAGAHGAMQWYAFRADMPLVYCVDKTPNGSVMRSIDLASGEEAVLFEGVGTAIDRVLMRADSNGVQAIRIVQSQGIAMWSVWDPSIEQDFIAIRRVLVRPFDVVARSVNGGEWLLRVDDDAGPRYAMYAQSTRQIQMITLPVPDGAAATGMPQEQAPDDR